jgi:hypothetical protein
MTKNLPSLTVKHNSLKVKMNRLRSQKVALQNKLDWHSKSERKARTRTLIQIGSLVNMIGLTELCHIVEGEDLQLDRAAQDKAATLLGMLTTLIEQNPSALSAEQEQMFRQKGIRVFKMYRYQNLTEGKNSHDFSSPS